MKSFFWTSTCQLNITLHPCVRDSTIRPTTHQCGCGAGRAGSRPRTRLRRSQPSKSSKGLLHTGARLITLCWPSTTRTELQSSMPSGVWFRSAQRFRTWAAPGNSPITRSARSLAKSSPHATNVFCATVPTEAQSTRRWRWRTRQRQDVQRLWRCQPHRTPT